MSPIGKSIATVSDITGQIISEIVLFLILKLIGMFILLDYYFILMIKSFHKMHFKDI